ncbi:putative PEP-binding protein [Kitasatospora sp. NPDC093679]|uniref:putative PEP-binding protein n=1 Tax=Kitasatospora sp. NPDC093679 TaxID=3154983 RepID=UPI0034192107
MVLLLPRRACTSTVRRPLRSVQGRSVLPSGPTRLGRAADASPACRGPVVDRDDAVGTQPLPAFLLGDPDRAGSEDHRRALRRLLRAASHEGLVTETRDACRAEHRTRVEPRPEFRQGAQVARRHTGACGCLVLAEAEPTAPCDDLPCGAVRCVGHLAPDGRRRAVRVHGLRPSGAEDGDPDEQRGAASDAARSGYDDRYREGFALECRALRRVRDGMGLTNLVVMIPFCRTPQEADRVLAVMADNGLERGRGGLRVFVMAEIPANVLLAEEFAQRFDGFSVGSNDLTQLTLGVDRDSDLLAHLFDESNPAVTRSIETLIATAHAAGRHVGLCGQRPSNDPAFTRFLVDAGIDSISVTPDSFAAVKQQVAAAEHARHRTA